LCLRGFKYLKPLPGKAGSGLRSAAPHHAALRSDLPFRLSGLTMRYTRSPSCFFRDQGQAELLANRAGKESPHRMLLPSGLLHDRRDRRPPAVGSAAQSCWPAWYLRVPGQVRLGRRPICFGGLDLLVLPCFARWAAGFFRRFAGRRIRRFVLHPDGLKAFLGDAQCARAVVIATPTPESSHGLGLLRPAPRSGAWPRPCRRRRRSVSARVSRARSSRL